MLINQGLLKGKLNIEAGVQEKTDGQALAITFKNGKVGAARNKTTIKNIEIYAYFGRYI